MKNKIKTSLRNIDPDWAGEIMDRHYKRLEEEKYTQRPMSLPIVRKYAHEMKSGQWKETPEPIIFDTDDNLVNGQHRLEAVRMSGKTVRMTVSTGWPPQTNGGVGLVDVVDSGRPRSISQLLHMHGAKNANNIAATVRSIATIAYGGLRPIMTYSNTTYLLDKLGVRDWIDRVMGRSNSPRDFVARFVGPVCYYYSTKPNKALDFADSVFNFKTGASPVQAFMRWAKNNIGKEAFVYTKALAAALLAFDSNEEVEVIKPSQEAMDWLSDINPIFRDQVRKVVSKAREPGVDLPPRISKKATETAAVV